MSLAKGNFYVSNKEFLQEMIKYKANIAEAQSQEKEKPVLDECIARKIMLIAQRLSFKPNFINYTYRDEMVSDAIENCIRYVDNFNPDRSNNPFSYFTQICYFAFIRRIQKEKKEFHTKVKFVQQSEVNQQEHCVQGHDDAGDFSNQYLSFLRGFYDVELAEEKPKTRKKRTTTNDSIDLSEFAVSEADSQMETPDFHAKNDDVGSVDD